MLRHGDREEVTGATPRGQVLRHGDREEVLGNFTFLYLCRFFLFIYLDPRFVILQGARFQNRE
ncbi:hypothetical protein H6F39_10695 [Anabaena sp. FACHB-1250]|nr:hypothetical protein [Anabaena sp. FACHB-1250]